jgi:hypothetical protein
MREEILFQKVLRKIQEIHGINVIIPNLLHDLRRTVLSSDLYSGFIVGRSLVRISVWRPGIVMNILVFSVHSDGGKVVSLTHRPCSTPRNIIIFLCFLYSFLLEAE